MSSNNLSRVIFQPTTHRKLGEGIEFIVNAIRPTLGPFSRTTVIEQIKNRNSIPEILDSGGEIARRIVQLRDRDQDVGAMYLRHILWSIFDSVGDGTATAAVIFSKLYSESLRFISMGINASLLRSHLEATLPIVINTLKSQIVDIEREKQIVELARSLCFHQDLSKALGEIFWVIGQYGRIEIRKGYGRSIDKEFVRGRYWKAKLLTKSIIDHLVNKKLILDNPVFIVTDLEISDKKTCLLAVEKVINSGGKHLVILCDTMSDEVVGILNTVNKNPDKFLVSAIKLPGLTNEEKIQFLGDFASLTGAKACHTAAGESLSGINETHFGFAKHIWIESDHFGIILPKGDPKVILNYFYNLKNAYEKETKKELKNNLQKRLGMFLDGSATLWVGGSTPNEQEDLLKLAERTSIILRGVMGGGIVPGGGSALLNCANILYKRSIQSDISLEEKAANQIVCLALEEPIKTIISNAGFDPRQQLARIKSHGEGYGFDVHHQSICKPAEVGLWDPYITLKTLLEITIKGAALAITTDVIVHSIKPEQSIEP